MSPGRGSQAASLSHRGPLAVLMRSSQSGMDGGDGDGGSHRGSLSAKEDAKSPLVKTWRLSAEGSRLASESISSVSGDGRGCPSDVVIPGASASEPAEVEAPPDDNVDDDEPKSV